MRDELIEFTMRILPHCGRTEAMIRVDQYLAEKLQSVQPEEEARGVQHQKGQKKICPSCGGVGSHRTTGYTDECDTCDGEGQID